MIILRAGRAEARILPFGATLQSLWVPDRNGRLGDVVLGHDNVEGYRKRRSFYGAAIGRYANRIAGWSHANDAANALHGGPEGFDRRVWRIEAVSDDTVTLALTSPDGDQGFPGTLEAKLTYGLKVEADTIVLSMSFDARCDKETPCSLTGHSFFNLGGNPMDYELTIAAETYLPVDDALIPLEAAPVAETPFDFRSPRPIGQMIRSGHPQLLRAKGYDHNFCLDGQEAANVRDPASGRVMRIVTDQPGLQFYSGNFLDGTEPGKGGMTARMGDAICLEPQLWPDGPNRPDFPDPFLRPGQTYRHRTEYHFTTD